MSKSAGNRLNWDLTCNQIAKSADELIVKSKHVYDDVGKVSDDDTSFKSVMKVNNIDCNTLYLEM